jgi:hypothetical protein
VDAVKASGVLPAPQGGFDVVGNWWRFTRYEVRGGAVRPAADAALPAYDPWAKYVQARSGWGSSGGKAPYESLLDLVWRLRLRPTAKKDQPAELEPNSLLALLAWCAEHGLLGLLPHEAQVAHLASRWGRIPELEFAGTPTGGNPSVLRMGPEWLAVQVGRLVPDQDARARHSLKAGR